MLRCRADVPVDTKYIKVNHHYHLVWVRRSFAGIRVGITVGIENRKQKEREEKQEKRINITHKHKLSVMHHKISFFPSSLLPFFIRLDDPLFPGVNQVIVSSHLERSIWEVSEDQTTALKKKMGRTGKKCFTLQFQEWLNYILDPFSLLMVD